MDAPKLTMTPDEALLKQLQALEQVAEAGKQMAAIYAEIVRRGGGSATVPTSAAAASDGKPAGKMPLADAIFEDLKASKKPKTPQQIWRTLEASGYEPNSETPEESVKWALKKLVVRNADIVHVGWNQWHLRSKYKKTTLERMITKRAGRGGRSTEDHVTRTLEGMEKAKARGKLGHRPSKVNAKNVVTFKQMLVAGASGPEIGKALGMSVATVYAHRKEVEAWKIGEPWPPAEKPPDSEAQDEQPLLKLVKS